MSNANDRIGQAAEAAARELLGAMMEDINRQMESGGDYSGEDMPNGAQVILRHIRPAVDAAVAEAVGKLREENDLLRAALVSKTEACAKIGQDSFDAGIAYVEFMRTLAPPAAGATEGGGE